MTTPNFANRNKFKFLVHFDDTKSFEFFAKSFTFGGINIGTLSVPTPIRPMEYPGDSYSAEDCIIDFYLSENWESYIEMFQWLKRIKNGKTAIQNSLLFANMSLIILNTKYRDSFTISMIDCFPYSLTTINMDTDDTGTEPLMAQVLFKVNDYDIIAKN
jgi:hypothetical protein